MREVGSCISSSGYLSVYSKYRGRVEYALAHRRQGPEELFVPANEQKCWEHGVGQPPPPPGARTSALPAGLPQPKLGRRQEAGGSGESPFPSPMRVRFHRVGLVNQTTAQSGQRWCKTVVEGVTGEVAQSCRREEVINIITSMA